MALVPWCAAPNAILPYTHAIPAFTIIAGEGEEGVGEEGNGGYVDDNDYIVIGTIPIAVVTSEGGEGVGEDSDGDNINDNDIVVFGTISVTVIAEGMAMCDGEGKEGVGMGKGNVEEEGVQARAWVRERERARA